MLLIQEVSHVEARHFPGRLSTNDVFRVPACVESKKETIRNTIQYVANTSISQHCSRVKKTIKTT